jgi:hypothetical protein
VLNHDLPLRYYIMEYDMKAPPSCKGALDMPYYRKRRNVTAITMTSGWHESVAFDGWRWKTSQRSRAWEGWWIGVANRYLRVAVGVGVGVGRLIGESM